MDVYFRKQIRSRIRIGGALSRRANGPCPGRPCDILDPKLARRFRRQPNRGQGSNTYGNFPSFDGSDARAGGFSYARYNFPNGWFVGGEGGSMGLGMNGINQDGAFGNSARFITKACSSATTSKTLPLTVYAGFDTLKYNTGIGGPFAPFDSTSGTLPGYSAHAGVEFQPAPNVSLSLGFGYTQQSGRIDSDINSPSLPGASPFAVGGRR